MIPGEYRVGQEPVVINENRAVAVIRVTNRGDRPVQVGSHYHFFEANPELDFDRETAYGMRLNIASGTSIRFEPGEEKEVPLVAFAGGRHVQGFHGFVNGPLDDDRIRAAALERMERAVGRRDE